MAHSARAGVGRRLACVFLCVVLLSACDNTNERTEGARGEPQPSPTARDSLVIGLVGTLSGPLSWRGEDAFEGADVGVAVLNRSRAEDEPDFELVSLDDEGDSDRAVELVEQLSESPRTKGIIYAGPPGALPAAEDALAGAGIPALLCYGDLYGARKLTPHVFQTSPSYLWQSRVLARYIDRDRGYETVGIIAEDSADGRTAITTLRAESERAGLRLRRPVVYDPAEPDIGGALDALRDGRVETVVLHGAPDIVAEIAAALPAAGYGYTSSDDARIATAPRKLRRKRQSSNYWRPHVLAFDLAIIEATDEDLPAGMVATDTYARGAGDLPVPSFERFTSAFTAWWDESPTGWELRAYDSVQMIGWAADEAGEGDDLAEVLEELDGKRFGGLPVTFGPDDHTAVGETTVGLWTIPTRGEARGESELGWVPLARGFSFDGKRTSILPEDWKHLFTNPPPQSAPAPRVATMKYGITTPRGDPFR